MIWYMLFSFVVLLGLAIACENNEEGSRAMIFILGLILGGLWVAGLVIQYGVGK